MKQDLISKNNVRAFRFLVIVTLAILLHAVEHSVVVAQTATPTPTPLWTQSGANISNTNTGNVGIGTASPTDKLHINGNIINGGGMTIDTPGTARYRIGSLGTTVPNWGGQFINAKYNQGAGNWTLDDPSLNAGFLKLDVRNLSFGNEVGIYRMSAGSNPRPDSGWTPIVQFKLDTGNVYLTPAGGNVGIGTNTPAAKLDVAGNINASGNITASGSIAAKYQDVAEWVPSTESLKAGTVVVLDPAKSNHVIASTSSYDTSVAGVVTTQPGIALGEPGEGKTLVATTGRVKVKVDATRRAIRVGDLLVTSEVEGVAMKSTPVKIGGTWLHRPGTIVGKALEALEKGKGEILVLLSLQ